MTYVQHKWGKRVHVVHEASERMVETLCGVWYWTSMSFTPDLHEREDKIVCGECRRIRAAMARKKLYERPVLRRGLSQAKQRLLSYGIKNFQERQRLEAWNKVARKVT